MSQLPKLRKIRQDILGHIGSIEEMRRGSVIRQFFKTKRRELNVPVLIGPYALYTFKKKGKTFGRRLRDPEEIRRLEEQVENYHVFRRLCRELVDVSEQICEEKNKK
jgi:hypothetical protein